VARRAPFPAVRLVLKRNIQIQVIENGIGKKNRLIADA